MTDWTLILCEGAHDQAFLGSLMNQCAKWDPFDGAPSSQPIEVRPVFPTFTHNSKGVPMVAKWPTLLQKGDCRVVIRNLGGDENVFGRLAKQLLSQLQTLSAIGFFVDANDKGVSLRTESCRECLLDLKFLHASAVEPGVVRAGNPRLGLWVAPNNNDRGTLDVVLHDTASRGNKQLVDLGEKFIGSLEADVIGPWTRHRSKALLGAIHQAVVPGASLAVGLEESHCWMNNAACHESPLKDLIAFIERLAGVQDPE